MADDSRVIIARSPKAIGATIDGQTLIVDVDTGSYFGLDDIGTTIWAGMAVPRSLEDLCERTVEAFDGDPEVIRRETTAFVEHLKTRGLLISG